jgi:hypothetical protein
MEVERTPFGPFVQSLTVPSGKRQGAAVINA